MVESRVADCFVHVLIISDIRSIAYLELYVCNFGKEKETLWRKFLAIWLHFYFVPTSYDHCERGSWYLTRNLTNSIDVIFSLNYIQNSLNIHTVEYWFLTKKANWLINRIVSAFYRCGDLRAVNASRENVERFRKMLYRRMYRSSIVLFLLENGKRTNGKAD